MKKIIIPALVAMALAGAANAQESWKLDTRPSLMDPSLSQASVLLYSTNNVLNDMGRPEKASLIVRCEGSGRWSAYINWPSFIGGDYGTVAAKWDDGRIARGRWEVSSTGRGIGHFGGRDATNMIKTMASHRRLVVSVEAYRGSPQEAAFDLGDVSTAVQQTRTACGLTG